MPSKFGSPTAREVKSGAGPSDRHTRLSVARLDRSRRADFYRFHAEICDAGWCNCAAWWVPTWDGWGKRSAEQNRNVRDRLFDQAVYDGYLLYDSSDPIGWCQVLERDRLDKLVRQFDLTPDPDTWAVTCFMIAPSFRRSGLAKYLLDQVIFKTRDSGAKRWEAFPKRGENLDVLDLWNGPESIFLAAGFKVVREHPVRPVLALDLDSVDR